MTASNLATRCAACCTVFRVVPDQLRVSAGWVRCGRCAAVFDATLDLFDIDQNTPVALDIAAHPQGAIQLETPAQANPASSPPAADMTTSHGLWLRKASLEVASSANGSAEPEPANAPSMRPDAELASNPAAEAAPAPGDEAIVIIDHVAGASGASVADILGEPPAQDPAPGGGADPADSPAFVRQADRAARWRSPGRRAVLLGGAGALGLLLALQAALLWRDLLAAHVPPLEPALQLLCRPLACQVLPLRRIERLSLESTNLGRLDPPAADPDASAAASDVPRYRLSLLLRNRADTALMLPALDLSLTDARGRLVARRVLAPADLGLSQDSLGAGQELPLQALLAIAGLRVEGYTVELFYP